MEFVNEFTVPIDIETAFETLTDLRQVAECLPGASLETVEDDTYSGSVKVKVGPIVVTYQGTAQLVDVDHTARSARIEARGKETRGSGTAEANVNAMLTETGDGTLVKVRTDLTVTGKPAQFGRGVIAEVGTKIIDEFSEQLRSRVLADSKVRDDGSFQDGVAAESAPEQSAAQSTTPAAPSATERSVDAGVETGESDGDVLNLMDFAGPAAAKRALPVVAGLVAAAYLLWRILRR